MAGEDPTNKPDLRADPNPDAGQAPEPEQKTEPEQKDAPLPAFIYGRDGRGDAQGQGNRFVDRQNFNAWIGDMDRKTLLGLVTGAGMLGLVLFFAGMLVGAGLFMESNDTDTVAQKDPAPIEMLATEPDAPVMSEPVPDPEMEPAPSQGNAQTDTTSNDPVGDLIAERTDTLSQTVPDAPEGDETTSDNADATSEPMETPAAPDLDEPADKKALSAPEIRETEEPAETAEAEAPAAEEQEPAAAQQTDTAEKAPATPEPATSEPAEKQSEPTAAASNEETPFSVQVGAFKVHENASQRAEELRKTGLEVAVVIRGPEGEGAWYYVRVGKYANLAQARDDAAKIKKNQGVDGFPVRAEPNDREVN